MRRRKSREYALQILFSLENTTTGLSSTHATAAPGIVSEYLKNFGPRDFETSADVEFLKRLTQAILRDLDSLDAEIEKYSDHWKLYRMTRIDRNILRIGAEELKNFSDVPPRVTMDECVELAKRFGTEESSAFVNGILDRLRTALGRKDE